MENLAIFASGSGTNAQRIMEHFAASPAARVVILLTNNPEALALKRAERLGIPTASFSRSDLYQTEWVPDLLRQNAVTFIVLAGFLWLVPDNLLRAYPNRIVNIHPALLPKYGGKGMYGMRVHDAVIAAGETESGITIHYVNEKYDDGQIIFQAKCPVSEHETPESLATKVHVLEYEHFPRVIEEAVRKLT